MNSESKERLRAIVLKALPAPYDFDKAMSVQFAIRDLVDELVAAEREACAKVCERTVMPKPQPPVGTTQSFSISHVGMYRTAPECAEIIRARGRA